MESRTAKRPRPAMALVLLGTALHAFAAQVYGCSDPSGANDREEASRDAEAIAPVDDSLASADASAPSTPATSDGAIGDATLTDAPVVATDGAALPDGTPADASVDAGSRTFIYVAGGFTVAAFELNLDSGLLSNLNDAGRYITGPNTVDLAVEGDGTRLYTRGYGGRTYAQGGTTGDPWSYGPATTVTFSIDPQTGALTEVGRISVPPYDLDNHRLASVWPYEDGGAVHPVTGRILPWTNPAESLAVDPIDRYVFVDVAPPAFAAGHPPSVVEAALRRSGDGTVLATYAVPTSDSGKTSLVGAVFNGDGTRLDALLNSGGLPWGETALVTFAVEPVTGTLTLVNDLKRPAGLAPASGGLALHPNGRFLYASRHAEYAVPAVLVDVYSLDPSGVPTSVGPAWSTATAGTSAIGFGVMRFDPSGRYLFGLTSIWASALAGGSLVVYAVDPVTGTLSLPPLAPDHYSANDWTQNSIECATALKIAIVQR